jgi:Asp-tRNA(Asn)/Glu-tRNA(Gln) amidotransferase A subunit family amidase
MTAYESLEKIRSGEIALSDFITAIFETIEKKEPRLQVFAPHTYDRSWIQNHARMLTDAYPNPGGRPPLFGLPVGIKDIIRVDGYETRCGSKLPPSLFRGEEASSVKRLKDAGALMFGKTVTAEFAGTAPGPTRNPHNPDHTPGGSSSGSAAGVAAGYFLLALGTQTSGSVIRPAAFCGVVGFKPSLGRVPTDGVIPFSRSTDHVGIFVPDTSLITPVMNAVSDGWKPVPASVQMDGPDRTVRLGIPEGPYLDKTLRPAIGHFRKTIDRIGENGFIVRPVPVFDDIETLHRCHRRLVTGEITRVHRKWYRDHSGLYRRRTAAYFDAGREVTEEELEQLRGMQMKLRDRIESLMEKHEIDAWICPAATGAAPKGIDSTGDPIMNMPWTNAGLPAITIPDGTDGSGLPYGLQIAGKFMEDEKTAAIAGALEKLDHLQFG